MQITDDLKDKAVRALADLSSPFTIDTAIRVCAALTGNEGSAFSLYMRLIDSGRVVPVTLTAKQAEDFHAAMASGTERPPVYMRVA